MLSSLTISKLLSKAILTNQISKSFINSNIRLFSIIRPSDSKSEAECKKKEEFKEKESTTTNEINKLGEDYPFELDADDYVPMINKSTGEWNPPRGVFNNAEPTRFGDWEIKGRCFDF